jgi:hypothetical protein
MGLAEARNHLGTCPELTTVLPRRIDWLAAQADLDRDRRHPLYEWLELADSVPEYMESLRALCAALRAPVGGDRRSRRNRLISGDSADQSSAMCELYMAAALAEGGLATTLGNPDLTVRDETGSLLLELTSAQKTADLLMLRVALAEALGPYSAGAELHAPHTALHLTTKQRQQIVEAAVAVAARRPVEPTSVGLDGIVSARDLRLAIVPSQPYLGLLGTSPFGGADAVAVIEAAINDKARQLSGIEPIILGIELSGSDWGSHLWALRVEHGEVPTVSVPHRPGLLGVLAFWQRFSSLRPLRYVWLANDAWPGPTPALAAHVLACLTGG